MENFPVVGIVGPRQVGKTTLAKAIRPQLKRNVLYIDLEYPGDLNKLADPVLFLELNQDSCIIIDEVQRMPNLFPILRSIIDKNREPGRCFDTRYRLLRSWAYIRLPGDIDWRSESNQSGLWKHSRS